MRRHHRAGGNLKGYCEAGSPHFPSGAISPKEREKRAPENWEELLRLFQDLDHSTIGDAKGAGTKLVSRKDNPSSEKELEQWQYHVQKKEIERGAVRGV